MSNNTGKTLGEIIYEAIKEKGLNQSFVAKKMHVARQAINSLPTRKTFTIEFLNDLKKATGLDFTKHATQLYIQNEEPTLLEESKSGDLKLSNMPKLTYQFAIPEEAYGSIKAFQDEVLKIAEKYGMIIQ
jgi:transcriptional regulator with XRE-family HTH domain